MNVSLIDVIIPAYNEQDSVAAVIGDIDKELVREVIVVDNNSTDLTRQRANQAGATVLSEPKQGYGAACLKGIEYIFQKNRAPDIVVFIDADYSDYPSEMSKLVTPILNGNADIVVGSRTLGTREAGAMTPQQIFGNWLATRLLHLFYGVRFTDLGPFRAIRWEKLVALKMRDQTYGWTVEMQLKAARQQLRYMEVPVNYKKRIGVSKISGTIKGTVLAGYKIITTIFKYV